MFKLVWRPILCTLLALVARVCSAAPSVHIAEIGLRGYFSTSQPTDIKLRIDPAEAAGHPLKVRIEVGQRKNYPTRVDVFTAEVDAKGPQELDLPLFLYTFNQPVTYTLDTNVRGRRSGRAVPEGSYIHADLMDEKDKKTIASDTADPVMNGAEELFVILCNEKAVCNTVQSQIVFGGSEEERDQKNRSFKFAILNGAEAPASWWSYLRASQVVLAAPIARFTEQQRQALEQYVRQSGTLILLEKETGGADFLSAYRTEAITATAVPVGRGDLVRVEGLESKKLQELFSGKNLKKSGDEVYWQMPRAARDFASAVHNRVSGLFATHFVFPRLVWIVIWLLSYIIVVGFVNFTVLRAMRRREWAWITTPALALLYAFVIYMVGNFHRPSNFALDQVTFESLDERNPTAAVATDLRVSSPRVQDTTLLTPTEAILMPPSGAQRPQAIINIEEHEDWEPGWDISYGKRRAIVLPLLRWDFRDFEFRDFVQLPGTLHRNAAKRLRNDTGRSFEDALYVDHTSTVFLLGTVSAGAEIDLSRVRWQLATDFSVAWRRNAEEFKGGKAGKPLGLKEVVAEAICDCFHDREYFIGLSRGKPAWEPELAGLTPAINRAVITLVTLDAQHD